jgi:hypothetical protein
LDLLDGEAVGRPDSLESRLCFFELDFVVMTCNSFEVCEN